MSSSSSFPLSVMSVVAAFLSVDPSWDFGFLEVVFCFLFLFLEDLEDHLEILLFHFGFDFCFVVVFLGFLEGLVTFLGGFVFGVL